MAVFAASLSAAPRGSMSVVSMLSLPGSVSVTAVMLPAQAAEAFAVLKSAVLSTSPDAVGTASVATAGWLASVFVTGALGADPAWVAA